MIKVFFDASVIFSAIYSTKGGSHKLTSLIKQSKIIGITSQTVVKELEDNLKKIGDYNKRKLHQFIIESGILVREEIKRDEITPFFNKVEEKDAHVVAGAINSHCQYLVTLDKRHLNNKKIKENFPKIKIVSPKDILSSAPLG